MAKTVHVFVDMGQGANLGTNMNYGGGQGRHEDLVLFMSPKELEEFHKRISLLREDVKKGK